MARYWHGRRGRRSLSLADGHQFDRRVRSVPGGRLPRWQAATGPRQMAGGIRTRPFADSPPEVLSVNAL